MRSPVYIGAIRMDPVRSVTIRGGPVRGSPVRSIGLMVLKDCHLEASTNSLSLKSVGYS